MSYLDERDKEESASLETQVAQFRPRPHRERDPNLPAVAAEVGKGRGFTRLPAQAPPAVPDTPRTSPATHPPLPRGESPKRKQVSRRSRAARKTDSGQITLTGSFDTLDRLVRRATWDRLTYVGLIERMLDLYEAQHGAVPEDFVP